MEKLHGNIKIAVIGLGYVGLPLQAAFAEYGSFGIVGGYDIDSKKVELLNKGIDPTNEVGDDKISELIHTSSVFFTDEDYCIADANVYIIAVPTPINYDKTPNLEMLKNATGMVAHFLKKGDCVIFESTVAPTTTDEILMPMLEEYSNLKVNEDFFVGYSPERVAPATPVKLADITKVVAGSNEETTDFLAWLYDKIITAGVHKAPSIAVAEASKMVENIQRDVNIALMNEMAINLGRLGIDTTDVLEAARTKWNFVDFRPGLVGGHCIGVDPWYMLDLARKNSLRMPLVKVSRDINDDYSWFILKDSIGIAKEHYMGKRIAILGATFKENCNDIRNSGVKNFIYMMRQVKADIYLTDPLANEEDVFSEFGLELTKLEDLEDMDVVIVAVAHDEYKKLTKADFDKICVGRKLIDVKSLYNKEDFKDYSVYWRP